MTDTLERALERIAALHGPDRADEEEIETFHEDDETACPAADGWGCPGHLKMIKVCGECGTAAHPEFDVWYFPWPCPTYKAAADGLGREVPA